MILLRGIKGETYARKIEKGIVDCRDILSAVLDPPKTGYEYSDYYEKNLVRAITYCSPIEAKDIHNPEILHSVLIDPYIPHIYLTYFHVLNENSVNWLEKFDDEYSFIAINVKLDCITKTAIGNGYFGAKMQYVDSIQQLNQDSIYGFQVACLCSLENQFKNKQYMAVPVNIYNTLSFPLLCREVDEKYTDLENEFRFISYDCPMTDTGIKEPMPREVTITGSSGVRYSGVLGTDRDPVLKSNLCLLKNQDMYLSNVLSVENGKIAIDSRFKSIDIREISEEYIYVGDRRECEAYIKRMNSINPKDVYVRRTKIKRHKRNDLKDAIYTPGHRNVGY